MPYATVIVGSPQSLALAHHVLESFLQYPEKKKLIGAGIDILETNSVLIDLEKAGHVLGELQIHCAYEKLQYSMLITEEKQNWYSWPSSKPNAATVKLTGI